MAKRILVCNDDGILGDGLVPLVKALRRVGQVTTIVPESERSTASHALTLHKPLRLKEFSPGIFTLSGTPADCARFGLLSLLKGKADILVSGINRGFNLGEDVLYSGTVGAAYEGALLGIPSLAVSQGAGSGRNFPAAAAIAAKVARDLLNGRYRQSTLWNLNVPDLPASRIKGLKPAFLGRRVYDQEIAIRKDPGGRDYFWMQGRFVSGKDIPGSDIHFTRQGYASLTPLKADVTDQQALEALRAGS